MFNKWITDSTPMVPDDGYTPPPPGWPFAGQPPGHGQNTPGFPPQNMPGLYQPGFPGPDNSWPTPSARRIPPSGVNLPPLDQRPTPSAVPEQGVNRTPRQGKTPTPTPTPGGAGPNRRSTPTPSPTPSMTLRATTPTPVIRDRQQLYDWSQQDRAGAASVLPRLYGNDRTADFADMD